MPSSTRAAAPACRRAEGSARTEVRFRAAAGVGKEAPSRQPYCSGAPAMVKNDECGDVRTRGGPHCDGSCLCRA
eukprot:scaffold67460_cov73-Phaeocystis_antarctica.AAC.2